MFFCNGTVGASELIRWSQAHSRPLMGAEMLAVMGIPCTQSLAEAAGVQQPDLSTLKNSHKANSCANNSWSAFACVFRCSWPEMAWRLQAWASCSLLQTWPVQNEMWLLLNISLRQAILCLEKQARLLFRSLTFETCKRLACV